MYLNSETALATIITGVYIIINRPLPYTQDEYYLCMRNFFFVSKVECPAPPVPVNVMEPVCNNSYLILSVCTFTCKSGFLTIPNGVYNVQCRYDQKWDSQASDCRRKLNAGGRACVLACGQAGGRAGMRAGAGRGSGSAGVRACGVRMSVRAGVRA